MLAKGKAGVTRARWVGSWSTSLGSQGSGWGGVLSLSTGMR